MEESGKFTLCLATQHRSVEGRNAREVEAVLPTPCLEPSDSHSGHSCQTTSSQHKNHSSEIACVLLW